MTSEYILKHRDTPVAEFEINRRYNRVNYLNIIDDKFSPVNTKEDELSQGISFNSWLSERCVPNSREGVDRLKRHYKIEDVKQLMLYMYGLSLSDHYWIDRKPFNNKWDKINLFENLYDEITGEILFDKDLKLVENYENIGRRNPNVTTGGSLRKYWRYNKNDNRSYLVKAGSKKDYQEPFNECFSHLLLEKLNFEHTPYFLEKIGNEYVSICPCIADKETEMVSAGDLMRKYGIEKSYNAFVGLGEKKGCIYFKDEVNRMIILDYLTDNIDRHWYNFGILRNSQDGSWKGLIPIFDNGYSLWNKDFVNSEVLSESQSFADSNEECMRLLDVNKYIKKVPDLVEIFNEAFEKYENTERKKELLTGLTERVVDINNFIDNKTK
jgi:hypothetical protein